MSLLTDPCAPAAVPLWQPPAADGAAPIYTIPAGKGPKQIMGPDPNRRSIDIVNTGTVTVYIGFDSLDGVSGGFPLAAGAGWSGNVGRSMAAFVPAGAAADGLLAVLTTSGVA